MTTTVNPYAYSITVREMDFNGDSHFEARVKELPDVREYAASAGEAYELAIDTIETAAAMFAEEGRSFPSPAVLQDDFSGRVTLRLSKSMHRALASSAQDEGVSLNQHLVNVLTYDQGFSTGEGFRHTRSFRAPWVVGELWLRSVACLTRMQILGKRS